MTFNLRLIPLLPFLGAAILMLFGRKWKRDTVFLVAALAIAAPCVVVLDAFFTALPERGHRRPDRRRRDLDRGRRSQDRPRVPDGRPVGRCCA